MLQNKVSQSLGLFTEYHVLAVIGSQGKWELDWNLAPTGMAKVNWQDSETRAVMVYPKLDNFQAALIEINTAKPLWAFKLYTIHT